MILGRVVGDVVSTVKNEHLAGNRLLLVEPIDLEGQRSGAAFLALDTVDAGPDDTVLVIKEGGSVRLTLQDEEVPLQTLVVAVVDRLERAE